MAPARECEPWTGTLTAGLAGFRNIAQRLTLAPCDPQQRAGVGHRHPDRTHRGRDIDRVTADRDGLDRLVDNTDHDHVLGRGVHQVVAGHPDTASTNGQVAGANPDRDRRPDHPVGRRVDPRDRLVVPVAHPGRAAAAAARPASSSRARLVSSGQRRWRRAGLGCRSGWSCGWTWLPPVHPSFPSGGGGWLRPREEALLSGRRAHACRRRSPPGPGRGAPAWRGRWRCGS